MEGYKERCNQGYKYAEMEGNVERIKETFKEIRDEG